MNARAILTVRLMIPMEVMTMSYKTFLKQHFMNTDGSKRRHELIRYAAGNDGTRRLTVRWEGEERSYGPGSAPDVQIIPTGDQSIADDYAEFLGQAPMRLANALEDLEACRKELARFEGQTWRGEAVAIEDDGPRGGIWVHGAGILEFPGKEWDRHLAYWYPSWEALASVHALSPCGVGVNDAGQPYVRLKPYPKPKMENA